MTTFGPLLMIQNGDPAFDVDLLGNLFGFHLEAWRPQIPEPKGGGIFADSPLVDGRRLIIRKGSNYVDTFTFKGAGCTQDDAIDLARKLRRTLEGGIEYWLSRNSYHPAWITARSPDETETRYALILDYRIPEDDDPYAAPFFSPGSPALMDELSLIIEHAPWQETIPGTGTCVQISGNSGGSAGVQAIYRVPASTSDCYVTTGTASIDLAGTELRIGAPAGGGGSYYNVGLRFSPVNISKTITINSAKLYAKASASSGLLKVTIDVYGDDEDNAAVFSTYANFTGRPKTTAFTNLAINNDNPITAGQTIYLGDVRAQLTEIMARAGWAPGNAIAFILEVSFANPGNYRSFASFDHASLDEPWVEIEYTISALGQEATCDDLSVFVQNCFKTSQLSHVFIDDGGVFGPNLLAAALPYALFPAVLAGNDALYLGVDTSIDNSGPFANLIFNLSIAQSGNTFIWEYWNGAWVAFTATPETIQDNTLNPAAFQATGVNSIHWEHPVDWATTAVNGITGYWVRARVVAGGGSPPTQATRHPYTISWSGALVTANQIGGDMPTLAKIKANAHCGNPLGLTPNRHCGSHRIIAATRSTFRGEGFTAGFGFSPFIPLADEQFPSQALIYAFAGENGSFVTDVQAGVGRALQWNPPVTTLSTDRLFGQARLNEGFYGEFHAFIRAKRIGGTSADISLKVGFYTSGNYYLMSKRFFFPTAAAAQTSNWTVLDIGAVAVPPGGENLAQGEKIPVYVHFLGSCDNVAVPGDLVLHDLILMPIDEWYGDFRANNLDAGSGFNYQLYQNKRYLDIDSILHPRRRLRAILNNPYIPEVVDIWQPITAAEPILQENQEQIIYLMSMYYENNLWMSYPEAAYSLQTLRSQRYISLRGTS